MSILAVIFDLDGVIVTTDELHYEAWKYMAEKEGIHFDKLINNRLRGVSRMESLDIILEKANRTYDLDEKHALAQIKNDYYVSLLKHLTPKDILKDVVRVINKLKERGIKVAIGSSSKNTPVILKQIGLDQVFDTIVDGNDIVYSKPHPEVFLKAAERLNIDPKHCAVVEDAEAGIVAANRAGMTSIAVSDAKKSELARYRIDELEEILSIV